jgi:hypothetical protein
MKPIAGFHGWLISNGKAAWKGPSLMFSNSTLEIGEEIGSPGLGTPPECSAAFSLIRNSHSLLSE